MALDKIQNLSDGELKTEEAKAAEQLFRLRFQQGLGNNEGVKNIRGLRKDVARIKTLESQRRLGIAKAPTETDAPTTKKKAKKG
ncbi:50S ribosomal protein L29 [Terriglobus saanensis]|uniref:Large ribosomal subunit protein uL29 n=1 Tax=Terriglobus saanensis (strain ATCC BAA-1853 / DSM 23119 / SP1PR4) TaxID=401053 RepID=E8V7L0_TERSS|nr:50S ribosomal protein L29 [Terriglobus saanensis]ADV83984.1 ribosomal protein L29 [Terriglobus saanensis SP1PR4]